MTTAVHCVLIIEPKWWIIKVNQPSKNVHHSDNFPILSLQVVHMMIVVVVIFGLC